MEQKDKYNKKDLEELRNFCLADINEVFNKMRGEVLLWFESEYGNDKLICEKKKQFFKQMTKKYWKGVKHNVKLNFEIRAEKRGDKLEIYVEEYDKKEKIYEDKNKKGF